MKRAVSFASLFITALAGALTIVKWDGATSPNPVSAAEPKSVPEFKRAGAEFLKKHCVGCHGPAKPKADLSLHVYVDEATILKDRKKWPDILKMVESGEMPPKEKPRPTSAELADFVNSVKGTFDRADKNAKPDPGRVTVRRLNKAEYNNTIRDLIGVDFNASEDFPSDDVGNGFDNIGDVLTLSPVLMERYLTAAETIVNRAIMVNPPKPPVRHMNARDLEPAGPNVPKTKFRPVTQGGQKGALNTPFGLTLEGEYIFKVRCYAKQAGDEPVKITLLLNGKEIKTFEVKSTDEKKPETFEVPLTLPAGTQRGAVQLLNEYKKDKEPELKKDKGKETEKDKDQDTKKGKGKAPEKNQELKKDKDERTLEKKQELKKDKDERTLYVEWLVMEGPLDTRPAFQRNNLTLDPAKSKAEQTRAILTRFVSRAYRRPAAKDEIDRLVKLVQSNEAKGDKWEAGMQMAFQAVLVSPKFLFRLELDDSAARAAGAPIALDEYQLASRLSYFLWSSMPDDELFELAAKKQLRAQLDAQVKRMLKDAKAKALVDNFVMQWLQLRNLNNVQPDATLFPTFNDRLRKSMLKETELFFTAIMQEDRSILDIIDADFTFLNQTLARHYGLTDSLKGSAGQPGSRRGGGRFRDNDTEFERVTLKDGNRGGILTQASVLTVTSNPTRTSPVKRGRWVLEQLLGTPPPPPPPNVPELATDMKAISSASLRQRMEQHRENVACANCHAKMDPLGFAFENFNAIGAYRNKDGEFPIDASGILPDGKTFNGPKELKQILKEKKDLFSRCLAEKMLIYAVGRGLEYFDQRPVDTICSNLARNGYKFSSLVAEIVKSDQFQLKRAGP